MRTFLTMLGIIIGVCAVIVLVSVVQGSTGRITESIESLGANAINVTITGRNSAKSISYDEMQGLKEQFPDLIEYVVPNMSNLIYQRISIITKIKLPISLLAQLYKKQYSILHILHKFPISFIFCMIFRKIFFSVFRYFLSIKSLPPKAPPLQLKSRLLQ